MIQSRVERPSSRIAPSGTSVSFAPSVRLCGSQTVTVAPGETVVALGAHLLHEGDRVRSAETRTAAQ